MVQWSLLINIPSICHFLTCKWSKPWIFKTLKVLATAGWLIIRVGGCTPDRYRKGVAINLSWLRRVYHWKHTQCRARAFSRSAIIYNRNFVQKKCHYIFKYYMILRSTGFYLFPGLCTTVWGLVIIFDFFSYLFQLTISCWTDSCCSACRL